MQPARGLWGGYNEKVEELEAVFAAMHGVRNAISCANGTVALGAALHALAVQCGDEAIVPPFTFVDTDTGVPVGNFVRVGTFSFQEIKLVNSGKAA